MASALTPDGWLVIGLPWPAQSHDGYAECAAAIAPQLIPRHLVSAAAGDVLDLAAALARSEDGPGKTVFFSDVTLWLDRQGKTWADLRIDDTAVIEELLQAPVPMLSMSLSQIAHMILCDASREGVRIHYINGRVEHVTPATRHDVHGALTASLERDWRTYIQDLIERGAVRTE